VNTSRERDQSVERLLRQSLQAPRHAGVTDSCLDAETLAAWVDGGLSGAALEMAQSHVADCARCQSLVGAMARTDAVVPQPEAERATRRRLAWLVPLTAAAAAAALWVAVPRERSVPLAPAPPAANAQREENQPQAPVSAKDERPAPAATNQVERQAPAPELRKDTGRLEADVKQEQVDSAPAAAARSVASAAPEAQAAGLARSANVAAGICSGGWNAVPVGLAAELTAGAAPSSSVCWVVGRGGVVLLSIDASSWRRVAFPEITDLSAVQATDARTATVSTADGRIFNTSDGGVTWDQR
jgi:hypothetical protein